MSGETIRVALTDRLVGELPRFFNGLRGAFIEIFQNAWRAGAQNVTAHLENNVLTIHDDGRGCPDPQLLLAAGATGWDESRVVEPAGLGFFSLLSKDVAASVEAESHGWRVTLIPSHVLSQKPVQVERGPSLNQHGMKLKLMLVSPHIEHDFTIARGFYPFNVTLNGKLVPPTAWKSELDLMTPVGKVGLQGFLGERTAAIWDYRRVEGEGFSAALQAASTDHPLRRAILDSYHIQWMVDPRSGVLPKLPDRNDLMRDPALDAAARTILDVAVKHFLDRAQEETKAWPDTVVPPGGESRWLTESSIGKAVLAHLGWAHIDCIEWRDQNFWYVENDGWDYDRTCFRRFSKTYLRVRDEHVADSINNAVALGAHLPLALHTVDGLPVHVVRKRAPRKDGWVGLAREIRVGDRRLPFLLEPNGDRANVILACDADTATAALMGHKVTLPGNVTATVDATFIAFIAAVDAEVLTCDWGDYSDGGSLDTQKATRALLEQIADDFVGGGVAEARHELHRLREQASKLCTIKRTAQQLARELRGLPLNMVIEATERVEERLARKMARVGKQARLPREDKDNAPPLPGAP